MSARDYYDLKRAEKGKRFITGFCSPSNPAEIHATCKKFWGGPCDCDCHADSQQEGNEGAPSTRSSAPGDTSSSSVPGSAPGAGSSEHEMQDPTVAPEMRPVATVGHTDMGSLAERTTSLDSQSVLLAGFEVPEAQAQTTVPASPPADAGAGGAPEHPPLVTVEQKPSAPVFEVREPCVIDDLDEAVYHAAWTVPRDLGGSLSNSGAHTLLTKTPAHFAYEREHGRAHRSAFDIGHAVHARVLGVGAEVVRVPFDSYRTDAAKEARDKAYAEGKTPLKIGEHDEVGEMAEAVLRHKTARVLFEAKTIREQSIFWQDGPSGVFLRCRPDSRVILGSGRTLAVDLKTTEDASRAAFGKSAANYGYYVQHPWYLAGMRAHGLADDTSAFLFVAVEKTPPHLVNVIELDPDDVDRGRQAMRRAIDLYAECQGTDSWPGYSGAVESASLPYWFARQHDERYQNDDRP